MTQIGNKYFHNIAAAGETPIYKRTAGGFLGGLTLGTKQTFNSSSTETAVEFTNIPAGVMRISIIMEDFRFESFSSGLGVQIGDSGGYETSNYHWSWSSYADFNNSTSSTNNTLGDSSWRIPANTTGVPMISGVIRLERIDSYTWMMDSINGQYASPVRAYMLIGKKTLSGNLDKIKMFHYSNQLIPVDGGSVNISYI